MEAFDRAGITEFDHDTFVSSLKKDAMQWLQDHWQQTDRSQRREVWDEILAIANLRDPTGRAEYEAVEDFEYACNGERLVFQDFFDGNPFQCPTYRFAWCCYALQWAVAQYDVTKGDSNERSA